MWPCLSFPGSCVLLCRGFAPPGGAPGPALRPYWTGLGSCSSHSKTTARRRQQDDDWPFGLTGSCSSHSKTTARRTSWNTRLSLQGLLRIVQPTRSSTLNSFSKMDRGGGAKQRFLRISWAHLGPGCPSTKAHEIYIGGSYGPTGPPRVPTF